MTHSDAAALWRFLVGLRAHLRRTLSAEECRRIVRADLGRREDNFVRLLEHAVFSGRASPYRALFDHAGAALGDVRALVSDVGLEGALDLLRAEGVYVSLEEFRGLRPIVRPGLELPVRASDFDGAFGSPSFPGTTGGSRGAPRRLLLDLDSRSRDAIYHALFLDAFDAWDRPAVVWRPVPPGLAGLTNVLAQAKLGRRVERWFSQTRLTPRHGRTRDYAFFHATFIAARLAGRSLPRPEHVPIGAAGRVARPLAELRAARGPALFSTTGSSAVRVALAAAEAGLDLSGTLFRLGGEPFTFAKREAIRAIGADAVGNYTMTEAGRIGVACADPAAVDDYHVVTDKLALVQTASVGREGNRPPVLHLTTLLPSTAKLMVNVEIDDYGTLEQRRCSCPLGELGLGLHIDGVRSAEKLTSEGVHFLGPALIALVDEVLPARFGGGATDYQLVEDEVESLPRVSVVVSPRVGGVDEAAVVATVLETLGRGASYNGMMADVWRAGQTLRVVRREPYETPGAKILPLHVGASSPTDG